MPITPVSKILAVLAVFAGFSAIPAAAQSTELPATAMAGSGRFLYLVSGGRLLSTDDTGVPWISRPDGQCGPLNIRLVAVDPIDAQTVLAFAGNVENAVDRSGNFGAPVAYPV